MAKKLVRWYESKTIIVNSIGGFLGLLPELLSYLDMNVLTAIGVHNPAKYYAIIGVVVTFLNIYFRAQSSTPTAPIKTKARAKKLY